MPSFPAASIRRVFMGGVAYTPLSLYSLGTSIFDYPELTFPYVENPSLNIALVGLSEDRPRPLINQFKVLRDWQGALTAGGSVSYETLRSNGNLNSLDQVVSIPEDCYNIGTLALVNQLALNNSSGRWRLTWEGAGTIQINWASNVVQVDSNTIEFDYTATGDAQVGIFITEITEGPLRNFSLVHEDDWADHAAGEIFRRVFLNDIQDYRVIRFDNWQQVNSSDPLNGKELEPATKELYRGVMPYSVCLELCEKIGSDPWFCIHHLSDDTFVSNAAQFIHTNLNPKRHVYIEFSNKCWDFATPPANWCQTQANTLLGYSIEAGYMQYYGGRASQVAEGFQAVFGTDTRLHTVIQTHTDWLGLEGYMLNATDFLAAFPGRQPPHTYFTDYAVHALCDGDFGYNTDNQAILETWRTTLPEQEAFDRIRDQCINGAWFETTGRTIENQLTRWAYQKSVADARGMNLICYEGGSHLYTLAPYNTNPDFMAFHERFFQSPQWMTVFQQLVEGYNSAGGTLFTHTPDVWNPNWTGTVGLQRYYGEHGFRWGYYQDYNRYHPGPTGRAADAFQGTMEGASVWTPTDPEPAARVTIPLTDNIDVAGHSFLAFSAGYMGDGGGSEQLPNHWTGDINISYASYSTLKSRWDANGPEQTSTGVGALWITEFANPSGGSWPAPNSPEGIETLQYAYWYCILAQSKGVKAVFIYPPWSPENVIIDDDIMRDFVYLYNWLNARTDITIPVFLMPTTYIVRDFRAAFGGTSIYADGLHLRNESTPAPNQLVGALGMGMYMMMTGEKVVDPSFSSEMNTLIDIAWDNISKYDFTGLGGIETVAPTVVADPLPNPNPIPDSEPAGIDYTQAIAYIDANSEYAGTDSAVTSITSTGQQSIVFSAAGSGSPITHSADGFTFANGVYLQSPIMSNLPVGDGVFAVVEFTLTGYGAAAGQLLHGGGDRIIIQNVSGTLRVQAVDDDNAWMAAGAVPYGSRFVVGGRMDDITNLFGMFDQTGAYSEQGHATTDPALTRMITGRYVVGTLHRMAVFGRPEGGEWPATFEEVYANFAAQPEPEENPVQVVMARGQSLAKGVNMGGQFAPSGSRWRDVLSDPNVIMLTGLQRADGVNITQICQPMGVGYNTAVSATGEAPAYAVTDTPTGFIQSLDMINYMPEGTRLAFQFHDAGGQSVDNLDDDPNTGASGVTTYYDNAGFWLQEAVSFWGDVEVIVWDYDQGEANVSWPYGTWRPAFAETYGDSIAQILSATGQQELPALYITQTGGYMNKAPNSHWVVLEQVEEVRENGGVLVGPGWAHKINNADGSGVHMTIEGHLQRSLLKSIAVRETNAGNLWTIMPPATASRSGNTITIPLPLRSDEALVSAAGKYANYGGDPANLGLEVEGGGSITSVTLSGSNIIVEVTGIITHVTNAFQTTGIDYRTLLDANGHGYATHRSVIKTSWTETKQIGGMNIVLERFVPSFRVEIL